jgi:hypothetical protein
MDGRFTFKTLPGGAELVEDAKETAAPILLKLFMRPTTVGTLLDFDVDE